MSIQDWGADIALESSDGDIRIAGLQVGFRIRGQDGDIQIRDCETSRGSIRTSDGDVTLERCEGSIEVEGSDAAPLAALVTARAPSRSPPATVTWFCARTNHGPATRDSAMCNPPKPKQAGMRYA